MEIKENARNLRREGLSTRDISKKIGLSKSTIHKWVKDIKVNVNKYQNVTAASLRQKYRKNGVEKSNSENWEYRCGCALYWAEGSKTRNMVEFVNSDVAMMIMFVNFLKRYFNVNSSKISLSINAYLDNGLDMKEIERYWVNMLGLDGAKIDKFTDRSKYYKSEKKCNRHPYGVCKIRVYSTEIAQNIYGSIENLFGTKFIDK